MSKIDELMNDAAEAMKTRTPEENEFLKKVGSNMAETMFNKAMGTIFSTLNTLYDMEDPIVAVSFLETFLKKISEYASAAGMPQFFTEYVSALKNS